MDTQKLRVRLRRLDEILNDLRHLPPVSLADFLNDRMRQAATERQLQVAAQISLDIGASLVAEFGLPAPDDLPGIFTILSKAGFILAELGERMVKLARFRNVLIYLYVETDLKIVYERWTNGLGDFDDFARAIVAFIEKHDADNKESPQ